MADTTAIDLALTTEGDADGAELITLVEGPLTSADPTTAGGAVFVWGDSWNWPERGGLEWGSARDH